MRRAGTLALVMLSGCSFVLVSGPPSNHQQLPTFDCTTSRVGPGLDTAWTVLQTINVVGAATTSDADWDDLFSGKPPFARSTAIPIYGVLAALGAAGMYYGFTRTASCREAKNELVIRMMQPGGMPMQPAPGTWPSPSTGTNPPAGPAPQPGVGTWPPPAPAPAPSAAPPSTPAPDSSTPPAASTP